MSQTDKELTLMQGANSIFIQKGKVGCLLCHGFTGTPDEMKQIALYLVEKNISVIVPRLPGHGTTLNDMKSKRKEDWQKEYQNSYQKLAKCCDETFICGLSMGGILTLNFASKNQTHGIITLATPMKLRGLDMRLLLFLRPFIGNIVLKKSKKELADQKKFQILSYQHYPLGPASSLSKLIIETKKQLNLITSPILIVQGLLDGQWIVDSAKIINDTVSSKIKKLIYLEKSSHNIPKGPEINKVKKLIYEFIVENSNILKK